MLSLATLTIDALTPLEEWHYHIGEIKVPARSHLARGPLPLGPLEERRRPTWSMPFQRAAVPPRVPEASGLPLSRRLHPSRSCKLHSFARAHLHKHTHTHRTFARAHAQVDFSRASVNITLPGSLRRCACPT